MCGCFLTPGSARLEVPRGTRLPALPGEPPARFVPPPTRHPAAAYRAAASPRDPVRPWAARPSLPGPALALLSGTRGTGTPFGRPHRGPHPAPPRRPGGAPRARSRPVGFPEPGRGRKCAFLPPPPPPRRGRSSSPGRRRLSGNNPFGPSRPEPQPASPCEALRCVVFSPDRGWRILVAVSRGQRPARWVHAPSPKVLSHLGQVIEPL